MSRWTQRFLDHPVHAKLKEVRGFVANKATNVDANVTIESRRLLKVIEQYEKVLSSADKELFPLSALNEIHNQLQNPNFYNQLSQFNNSPSAQLLANANDFIEGQLPYLLQFTKAQRSTNGSFDDQVLRNAFDEFSMSLDFKTKSIEAIIKTSEEKAQSLDLQFEKIGENSEKISTELVASSVDWQAKFSEDQSKRNEEFSEAQIKKNKDFEEWLSAFKSETHKKSEDFMKAKDSDLSKFFGNFKAVVQGYKDEAAVRHQEILDLHQLVAGDSVAASYLNNADDEKNEANFWRFITICFILLTVVWLFVAYLHGAQPNLTYQLYFANLIKTIPLTAVLLYGSVYASKQSSLHRSTEKKARWFALEVKAFDPFIASLSAEERAALKGKMSERIFGQSHEQTSDDQMGVSPDMLKIILDAIKSVVSAK